MVWWNEESGETESVSGNPEVSMDSVAAEQECRTTIVNTCTHSRLIDNVLTKDGKWTGKVKCRECGAKFDDPYRSLK